MLLLPEEAVVRIIEEVRTYGSQRKETGGFLLVNRDEPERIEVVALAGTIGITRWWGQFGVSGTALGKLFAWADEHDLRIVAQFHSHGGRAFLSPTDLAHGFNVRGFVTCVIPSFRQPPNDPRRWGWWCFDGIRWNREKTPATTSGAATIVSFDENGLSQ